MITNPRTMTARRLWYQWKLLFNWVASETGLKMQYISRSQNNRYTPVKEMNLERVKV